MNKNIPPRPQIPSFWTQDKTCLHLGENPISPTQKVIKAITETARNANRYPDSNANALRAKLAHYIGHGVTPDNILCGNGSDELIDLAITAFCHTGDAIATFTPSFFVYAFAAHRHEIDVVSFSRKDGYQLPASSSLFLLDTLKVAFIANPNNPTGTLSPRKQLIEYIETMPGMVVVDECYFEFSGETVVDLISTYPNLVVFRSLSKSFGLAGLRLGYAVAHESVIDRMGCYALTFPVNVLAQSAGIAALDEADIYQDRVDEIIHLRDNLAHTFKELGLTVLPSHTNFLLTLWPATLREDPAARLASDGFLVSDQTRTMGTRQSALRIAVGTESENQRLIAAIQKILKSAPAAF
jgi:histidinol-phosphate aminotransferase